MVLDWRPYQTVEGPWAMYVKCMQKFQNAQDSVGMVGGDYESGFPGPGWTGRTTRALPVPKQRSATCGVVAFGSGDWLPVSGGGPTSHTAIQTDSVTVASFPARATLKHMPEVGIRALKQNASAVVAEAAAGATVTITDRGRPVAQMTAIPKSRLQALIDAGRARPARRELADLPVPELGPDLSRVLAEMRQDERY